MVEHRVEGLDIGIDQYAQPALAREMSTELLTYDSLSSKHNRERGRCVSHERSLLYRRKFIAPNASLMFGMQGFPDLSQSNAKPESGYQVEGADVDTEPGEGYYWFKSITI